MAESAYVKVDMIVQDFSAFSYATLLVHIYIYKQLISEELSVCGVRGTGIRVLERVFAAYRDMQTDFQRQGIK